VCSGMMECVADDPLSSVVSRLYRASPEEFVTARAVAVDEAKATGDTLLAARITKLRKPTVSAWVVNLLAHERPDLIADLLELGEQLRDAQRELRGDRMRELSTRRRDMVVILAREATTLASKYRSGNVPTAEVEATFAAALADREVAAEVQAGRLSRAVEYTGFGEVPRPQLRLLRGGGQAADEDVVRDDDTSEPVVDAAAQRRIREQRQRERVAARRELASARNRLGQAQTAYVTAQRELDSARRAVEQAEAALAAAEEVVQ
jgi:hypothetical protein